VNDEDEEKGICMNCGAEMEFQPWHPWCPDCSEEDEE
jgi:predicted amidophosphoribosyltransferase